MSKRNPRYSILLQFFSLLSFLLYCTSVVQAEVFECNGTWTNQPCPGAVEHTLANVPAIVQPAVDDPDRGTKRSLFHDLTMKSIRAKQEYGIKLDLSIAEKLCVKQLAPLEECSGRIQLDENSLDEKVKDAEALRLQQKAVAAQEEANKIQEERNKIEKERVSVRVVRRPIIVVRPDGSVEQQINNGGAGVQVNAVGSNGSVSISTGVNSNITDPYRPVVVQPRQPANNVQAPQPPSTAFLPKAPRQKSNKSEEKGSRPE